MLRSEVEDSKKQLQVSCSTYLATDSYCLRHRYDLPTPPIRPTYATETHFLRRRYGILVLTVRCCQSFSSTNQASQQEQMRTIDEVPTRVSAYAADPPP
eukprot:298286-Rhodomonas_salina.1